MTSSEIYNRASDQFDNLRRLVGSLSEVELQNYYFSYLVEAHILKNKIKFDSDKEHFESQVDALGNITTILAADPDLFMTANELILMDLRASV